MSNPFNPFDFMESDDEIVDYLVVCWFDDPDGLTYLRACEFVASSVRDAKKYAWLIFLAVRQITKREKSQTPNDHKHAFA